MKKELVELMEKKTQGETSEINYNGFDNSNVRWMCW